MRPQTIHSAQTCQPLGYMLFQGPYGGCHVPAYSERSTTRNEPEEL